MGPSSLPFLLSIHMQSSELLLHPEPVLYCTCACKDSEKSFYPKEEKGNSRRGRTLKKNFTRHPPPPLLFFHIFPSIHQKRFFVPSIFLGQTAASTPIVKTFFGRTDGDDDDGSSVQSSTARGAMTTTSRQGFSLIVKCLSICVYVFSTSFVQRAQQQHKQTRAAFFFLLLFFRFSFLRLLIPCRVTAAESCPICGYSIQQQSVRQDTSCRFSAVLSFMMNRPPSFIN